MNTLLILIPRLCRILLHKENGGVSALGNTKCKRGFYIVIKFDCMLFVTNQKVANTEGRNIVKKCVAYMSSVNIYKNVSTV